MSGQLNVPRLTLRITNMAGLPEGFPLAHRTEGHGFQIGRNPAMAWVLPDPDKRISGEHLRVHYQEGAYWLQDVSKNGTTVNGRPLEGIRRLTHDDLIGIGHYRILAVLEENPPDYGFAPLPAPPPERVPEFRPEFQPEFRPGLGPEFRPERGSERGSELAAPPPPSADQRLLQAMAQSAGLDLQALAEQDPERLGAEIGACLRIATEAMITLLAGRASTKKTIRSRNRTMMAPRGNNPLKASPGADVALEQLFIQRPGFFLTAPEAFRQGFADIGQHQTASYGAMQSALARMLGELAPETVEARAQGGIFPSRAARAWARYTRDWDARTLTHDQGMMDVFLAYFAQAYDRATEKSPEKAPEKTPEKAPEKAPDAASDMGAGKSAGKSAETGAETGAQAFGAPEPDAGGEDPANGSQNGSQNGSGNGSGRGYGSAGAGTGGAGTGGAGTNGLSPDLGPELRPELGPGLGDDFGDILGEEEPAPPSRPPSRP